MAADQASRLVKVPFEKRTADDEAFVIVRVTRSSPDASSLELIATENTEAFSGQISIQRPSQIKTKDCKDEDLLAAILRRVFLGEESSAKYARSIEQRFVSASAKGDKLLLRIGQDIGGITQRLGEITLKQNPSVELDLFSWAGDGIDGSAKLAADLLEARKALEAERGKTKTLSDQLDHFILLKKRQEDEMLEKFRQLLNTKKLKIRDQQRMLSGEHANSHTTEEVLVARGTSKTARGAGGKSKCGGKGAGNRFVKEESPAVESHGGTQRTAAAGRRNRSKRAVVEEVSSNESVTSSRHASPAKDMDEMEETTDDEL